MGLLLNKWSFQLVDVTQSHAQSAIDDDTGKIMVLTEDAPDSPVIYTDENGTTLTETGGIGVLTLTNGRVTFYTAATVTAVDLTGITADGRAIGINSVSSSQGRILINPHRTYQTVAVPFGPNNNSEQDTGLDLPANCLMTAWDVALRVTTLDATEDINVGILSSESGGDADGFIAVAPVGTAGFVELIGQTTGGTTIDFTGVGYVGALLASKITGSDAVATNGGFSSKMYRTDGTAKSISYTGSTGSDTAAGYVYLSWRRLPF